MPNRDPRVDPKAGDILAKGTSTVEIISANSYCYGFRFDGACADFPPMPTWDQNFLPSWRRWAKNAEVIHATD